MRRVSRSKFDRLQRATAGFTTGVLGEKWASLSFANSPHTVGLIIRFLFIGSRL
jgi:hypothetical protein